jgi:anaerobic selenocysteine-containing dehydrogenase
MAAFPENRPSDDCMPMAAAVLLMVRAWPKTNSSASPPKRLLETGRPFSRARAMRKANQPDRFDCPGCAWGDPEHGSSFEFCENGVKAVVRKATEKRVTPAPTIRACWPICGVPRTRGKGGGVQPLEGKGAAAVRR